MCVIFSTVCLLSFDYRWPKIGAYLKLNLFPFHYVRLLDTLCLCARVCRRGLKGENTAGQFSARLQSFSAFVFLKVKAIKQ